MTYLWVPRAQGLKRALGWPTLALVLEAARSFRSFTEQRGETRAFPVVQYKESACPCSGQKRRRFYSWVGKIPWSKQWQRAPVFLPGKSHGQRSLVGYSPWVHKESDATED